MNLLPWGEPVARAAVLKMDTTDLWHLLIPLQILGIVMTVGLAIVMMLRESKRLSQVTESVESQDGQVLTKEESDLKRPKLTGLNLFLTMLVLAILVWDKIPTYFVFMVGCAIVLLLNYPNIKDQKARVKAHAGSALDVASVMLAAGIMVGVLSESGMLEAMVVPLLKIIPASLASQLQFIMGILAFPLGTMLGTDSYFYGLMPLAIQVGENYDIAPLTMGIAMLIGKNLSLLIGPLVPATYLAISLTDLDLKDHIKYSFLPLWIVALLMLMMSVIFGLV
ncbi:hypothetical protein [Streptococcus pluranimalium]|uniref:hypothetical protein n=1 Tax=Streptococcus pluranimalium TaxID=82348 RepID=UPI003F690BEF